MSTVFDAEGERDASDFNVISRPNPLNFDDVMSVEEVCLHFTHMGNPITPPTAYYRAKVRGWRTFTVGTYRYFVKADVVASPNQEEHRREAVERGLKTREEKYGPFKGEA